MGNCQATEAASVVIQHPGGKVERLYWPTTAGDVMKSNPGYHVALVTLCISQPKPEPGTDTGTGTGTGNSNSSSSLRFTRVRLLKPKDMLLIGQVYRLITSQEVNKALRARKHEKSKRVQSELIKKQRRVADQRTEESAAVQSASQVDSGNSDQVANQDRDRQKSAGAAAKPRHWRPSLQSISEAGS